MCHGKCRRPGGEVGGEGSLEEFLQPFKRLINLLGLVSTISLTVSRSWVLFTIKLCPHTRVQFSQITNLGRKLDHELIQHISGAVLSER